MKLSELFEVLDTMVWSSREVIDHEIERLVVRYAGDRGDYPIPVAVWCGEDCEALKFVPGQMPESAWLGNDVKRIVHMEDRLEVEVDGRTDR